MNYFDDCLYRFENHLDGDGINKLFKNFECPEQRLWRYAKWIIMHTEHMTSAKEALDWTRFGEDSYINDIEPPMSVEDIENKAAEYSKQANKKGVMLKKRNKTRSHSQVMSEGENNASEVEEDGEEIKMDDRAKR